MKSLPHALFRMSFFYVAAVQCFAYDHQSALLSLHYFLIWWE
jgi:hypothetical protein